MNDSQTIIVAEDNPALAAVIRFNLQNSGYRVLVARNGLDAYQLITSESPDLLITDHQMPTMTGVELCSKLREDEAYQDLPILMLTAKALEIDKQQLLETFRVLQVFQKPFSPAAVVAAVDQYLNTANA